MSNRERDALAVVGAVGVVVCELRDAAELSVGLDERLVSEVRCRADAALLSCVAALGSCVAATAGGPDEWAIRVPELAHNADVAFDAATGLSFYECATVPAAASAAIERAVMAARRGRAVLDALTGGGES